MRPRIAEIDQHPVAHEFGDKAVVARDDAGNGVLIGADLLAQFLGVELRRQRRRADEIAEHHRQLPPLGVVVRLSTGQYGGCRQCLGGGQTGDGFEETLAVPERHTKLLEVDVGQLREDIGVDFTRAKERFVLSETETSQPTPDIHGRTPRGRTDHPSAPGPKSSVPPAQDALLSQSKPIAAGSNPLRYQLFTPPSLLRIEWVRDPTLDRILIDGERATSPA